MATPNYMKATKSSISRIMVAQPPTKRCSPSIKDSPNFLKATKSSISRIMVPQPPTKRCSPSIKDSLNFLKSTESSVARTNNNSKLGSASSIKQTCPPVVSDELMTSVKSDSTAGKTTSVLGGGKKETRVKRLPSIASPGKAKKETIGLSSPPGSLLEKGKNVNFVNQNPSPNYVNPKKSIIVSKSLKTPSVSPSPKSSSITPLTPLILRERYNKRAPLKKVQRDGTNPPNPDMVPKKTSSKAKSVGKVDEYNPSAVELL